MIPTPMFDGQMLALFLQAHVTLAGNEQADFPYRRLKHDAARIEAEAAFLLHLAEDARVSPKVLARALCGQSVLRPVRDRIWMALGVNADVLGETTKTGERHAQ